MPTPTSATTHTNQNPAAHAAGSPSATDSRVDTPPILTASPEELDALLEESLQALGNLVAWDLAVVYELSGADLVLRASDDVEGHGGEGLQRGRRVPLAKAERIVEAFGKGFAQRFDEGEGEFEPFDSVLGLPRGRHTLIAPLRASDGSLGALLLTRSKGGAFSGVLPELMDCFARLFALVVGYGEQSAALERLRAESEARHRMLSVDSDQPRQAAEWIDQAPSPAMHALARHAKKLAKDDAPLFVRGDAGVGKETLARALHAWSDRSDGPFVTLSCGAVDKKEFARRLYGEARVGGEVGALRAAGGGSLYLADIDSLPREAQETLALVIESGSFTPVGAKAPVAMRARLIAGSRHDLAQRVEAERFSDRLYYGLSAQPLVVPPLKARVEDVPQIARDYLASISERTGGRAWKISDRSLEWLAAQRWEGNVAELCGVLDRAVVVSRGSRIDLKKDPLRGAPPLMQEDDAAASKDGAVSAMEHPSLREMEKRHIERVLRATHGQIYGPRGAATLLEINPNTLRSRMKKLGIGGARSFRRKISGAQ